MTDPAMPPEPDAAAREKAARSRFLALSLFRLSGALILVFGLAIAMQKFGWVTGQKARIMGVIIATVGFIQMVLVPRLLLRAWVTPPQP
ncbi:MAG TPA: hypothetical protein VN627_09120 [Novosphingobium sp.]|jgi:hypothetical protein|nr:hypothetical protein [Novosphingobium sp.]